jgi:hypothetical protein
MARGGEHGAATVEHAGISILLALLAIAAVAALAAQPSDAGRELGFAVARKLRCGAQGPGPCWRDPLTAAYGRSLAGAVRALAPSPGPAGGLLPVDFRTCRSVTCARPGSRYGLTASNRAVTVFVSVAGGAITYWEYRPTIGWTQATRAPDAAEISTLAATPLLESQVPRLVPLETLAGANHFDFRPAEEPPWRWQVERR